MAAVLAATILLPAVATTAGPERSELEDINRRLDRLRHEIEDREADASTLESKVHALNRHILVLRNEVARLEARLGRVESEVRSAEARIERLQVSMKRVEERATEQAVTLYKAGATDALDALLDSESLGELDARAEMLGVAAQQNTDALVRYGRLRLEVRDQHRILFDRKEEIEAIKKARGKVLAELDERHAKLAGRLSKLEAKLGEQHAEEGALEAAAEAIRADIIASQASNAAEALGRSAQGFIWPLAGPITSYYGERWGRMHTGIDIDGTTGDPIVASKAGVVTLASSYSGYGNAVVIDHGGGIATLYAHLSSFAVSSGQHVSQGQQVGAVGCTGSCTGDHLHFEVRLNGNPVDPLDYLP